MVRYRSRVQSAVFKIWLTQCQTIISQRCNGKRLQLNIEINPSWSSALPVFMKPARKQFGKQTSPRVMDSISTHHLAAPGSQLGLLSTLKRVNGWFQGSELGVHYTIFIFKQSFRNPVFSKIFMQRCPWSWMMYSDWLAEQMAWRPKNNVRVIVLEGFRLGTMNLEKSS